MHEAPSLKDPPCHNVGSRIRGKGGLINMPPLSKSHPTVGWHSGWMAFWNLIWPFTNHTIDDEIQLQPTALKWFAEFLKFAPEAVVPLTPRLIPSILPNLTHHVPIMIQTAAIYTNKLLLSVIQILPSPAEKSPPTILVSPNHTGSTVPSRASTLAKDSIFSCQG
jgi:hypothetical protein